jgi:hypothetical protein
MKQQLLRLLQLTVSSVGFGGFREEQLLKPNVTK